MSAYPSQNSSASTIVSGESSPCVAVLIMDGFEEAEAMIIIDILRRLKIDVRILACQPEKEVVSYHKIHVRADATLDSMANTLFDAIVLPGGPQGARALGQNNEVTNFIRYHDQAQKLICAICSAGAHVLAANGLLHGRRYVCSGENHLLYTDGTYVDRDIVQDGNIISGRGLGLSFEFAFYVGTHLQDPQVAIHQANHIYVDLKYLPETSA